MPDYASILRRSVSALPDPAPEMREAVYQRARAALARQLTAVDPPLSTREIEAQHRELEDAVLQLETEFAAPEEEPAEVLGAPQPRDDFLYASPPASAPSKPAPVQSDEIDEFETEEEDEDDDEYADDEEQSSRTPLIVGLVLVLLVVVGAGAFAFAQRGTIMSFLGFDGEPEVAAVEVPPPEPAAAPQSDADKVPDRLTNGENVGPAAELPAPVTEAAPPEENAAVISGTGEQDIAALEPPGTSLVGQRAIYYFQGAEGTAGQASEGTVTWTETTRDGRPAIQATLRIQNPAATATLTIFKNEDTALPASHLVEIQFGGGLNGSPIQRVPALVLKQTEQARGQPLVGAAVPVTNELFWIALSDDAEQVEQNLRLLREGSWFDIPILFSDQTRALISFEKGIPGDKVFETVLSNWTAS